MNSQQSRRNNPSVEKNASSIYGGILRHSRPLSDFIFSIGLEARSAIPSLMMPGQDPEFEAHVDSAMALVSIGVRSETDDDECFGN